MKDNTKDNEDYIEMDIEDTYSALFPPRKIFKNCRFKPAKGSVVQREDPQAVRNLKILQYLMKPLDIDTQKC